MWGWKRGGRKEGSNTAKEFFDRKKKAKGRGKGLHEVRLVPLMRCVWKRIDQKVGGGKAMQKFMIVMWKGKRRKGKAGQKSTELTIGYVSPRDVGDQQMGAPSEKKKGEDKIEREGTHVSKRGKKKGAELTTFLTFVMAMASNIGEQQE